MLNTALDIRYMDTVIVIYIITLIYSLKNVYFILDLSQISLLSASSILILPHVCNTE